MSSLIKNCVIGVKHLSLRCKLADFGQFMSEVSVTALTGFTLPWDWFSLV